MASALKLSRILTNFTKTRPFPSFNVLQKRHNSSIETQYLDRGDGKSIAYRQYLGDNPGIIFVPGFQSNMQGVKASALEEYCRAKKLSYVRFDYQGCGLSSGDLREATLTDWKGDMLAVLDQITAGPQILVGSSMGGYLMLHAALDRPHRVHALVGIATAVDFPTRSLENYASEHQEKSEDGVVELTREDGSTYLFTEKFFAELSNHEDFLSRDFIPISCPIRLLHGMRDLPVRYEMSLALASRLQSRDMNVLLRKAGDHRFSQADDIQIIFEVLDYLIYGAPEAKSLAVESWSSFTVYQDHKELVWKDRLLHKYH